MKALSIKQPWASLIIYGLPETKAVLCEDGKRQRIENTGRVFLKDIENREWPLPESFSLPQRIYVHIPKRDDDFESSFKWLCELFGGAFGLILLHYSNKIPRGAIIGEVDIVDCVTESKSPWFTGKYGFLLKNPVPYVKTIPCKGSLGFFEPDIGVSDVQVARPSL